MTTLPEYDVFVSYRWVKPDQDWVRYELVPALQAARLRTLLDVEDFVPGRDVILEMARAGQMSRRALCIVSPDYFEGNRLVAFEALRARRADPTGVDSKLVPLIFRETRLPDWLQGLVPVDWTDPRGHAREWRKLLRLLGAPNHSAAPPGASKASAEVSLVGVRSTGSAAATPSAATRLDLVASTTPDQRGEPLVEEQPTGGLAPRLIRTLSGHDHIVHRIAWSRDGRFLASTSRDTTCRVWALDEMRSPQVLGGNQRWVNAVAWAPDGSQLALGLEDGRLRRWESSDSSWHCTKEIQAHRMRIECLDWSPDGRRIASASADYSVALWSSETLELLGRIEDHQAWVNAVAWSPSGRFLATGAEDNCVRAWDASGSNHQWTYRCAAWVRDIAWSTDESVVAVAAGDTVSVLDLATGRPVQVLDHGANVRAVSFSADSQLLASKAADGFVRIWSATDARPLATVPESTVAEENPESVIRFHPTRQILATLGEHDRVIRIWAIDGGTCLEDGGERSTGPRFR